MARVETVGVEWVGAQRGKIKELMCKGICTLLMPAEQQGHVVLTIDLP